MELDENDYIDILIIGGGISGLTSAYKIKEKNKYLNVVILEANPLIGGQLNSSEYGELGSKYISENQYHIYDLLKKFEIELNYLEKSKCELENITENSLKDEYWIKSKLINFEIKSLLNRIDIQSTSYDPGKFKISENDPSVEKFISNNLLFEQSRKILRTFVKLICGTAPNIIKLSEFLSVCNSGGGFQKLLDIYMKSELSSERLMEFSSRKLIEKFEILLKDVRILTNTKVEEIYHYPDYVIVRDFNGKKFNASVLILAIPWNSVVKLNIFPSIPKELLTSPSNINYYITSFILGYPNVQPWKKFCFCNTFMNVEEPTLIAYEYKSTKIAGIVLHDHLTIEGMSDYLILQKLSEKFGDEMLSPNIFVKKTFEQNLLLNLPQTTPWNRIIFSSTTAATSFRGCLNGAVQSGYRAAINALLIIRPQNVFWQDLDQIQKARPLKKHISWWKSFVTHVNLFHYCIISFGASILLIFASTKISKFSNQIKNTR